MKTNTETVTSGVTQANSSMAHVRATALDAIRAGVMGPKKLTANDYLREQQQQQAIKELPRWMPQVEADIAQLRQRYEDMVSLQILITAIALGALVLLMGSLIIIN